ncbi:transposase [Tautonia sociabilis]|uniref:ISL3 family transposase n=1 Tax=Tautonia sociabilis TaxID=2080755 RepID=A0A432MMA7_9BACT|nr:transposase [Tautonia sociabilis]RUL88574.1 ISL3 family transposase [Tautonia sociabilis]
MVLGFAAARRGSTQAFERHALDLSRPMTVNAVAEHLGVGGDVIKDIPKREPHRRFARPRLVRLRRIAIDEIAVGRRRFLTVVPDLDSGAVVFVGEGKGGDTLTPFWQRLRRAGAKVAAVVVCDRFLVVKRFITRLSDLRRSPHRRAAEQRRKVLKGSRCLLLKNPENLDPDRDQATRLAEALRLNEPLAAAYSRKEDRRRFWAQPDTASASTFLDDGITPARASGVAMLGKMADTRERHRDGLLADSDHRISTGPREGTNHQIKTRTRLAYGFRDQEFFQPKILAIHEATSAFVG